MKDNTERLDKYLANAGVCARRAVAKLIYNKNVKVNGKRVRENGIRIVPNKDKVTIDGVEVKNQELKYFLLNKPKGYISTANDQFGRKNVVSLINTKLRIYPVGRLDMDTSGLMILTNDGALTNLLTHPRYHIEKTYRLTLKGDISTEQIRTLASGVQLDDGLTLPAKVKIIKTSPDKAVIELTIREGRNRQIRRMCEALKLKLISLERIAIGGLKDHALKVSEYRQLSKKEVLHLKSLISK